MSVPQYRTDVAPAVEPVTHPPVTAALQVDGQTVATHTVEPAPITPDSRAPAAHDIYRNDRLIATVYGDTAEQAASRATRWMQMATAAEYLSNGEETV